MRRRRALFVSLAFLLCITASAATAQDRPATKAPEPVRVSHGSRGESPEARGARALQAARGNDGALYAFLREMPKGGDLHNHDSGAVYAETLVRFAADTILPGPHNQRAGQASLQRRAGGGQQRNE